MKSLVILFGTMFLCLSTAIASDKKLTIIVDGFKEKKGNLMIGIYNSEATFMKQTYKGFAVDVTDTSMECTIELPEGEYAISVYHDVNGNNKLDTATFGIPTEDYGFSNNAKGLMGAPSFEKAKFSVTQDHVVVRINLTKAL